MGDGAPAVGLVTSFQPVSIACDCVDDAQLQWVGQRSQGPNIRFIDLVCSECGAPWEYQIIAVKNPIERARKGGRLYELEPFLKATKTYTVEAFARRAGIPLAEAKVYWQRGSIPGKLVHEITYRTGVNPMHIWGSEI